MTATKEKTQPAMEAPPVDPAAVLQQRKQRRQAEGWQTARRLLVQPQLTEADVIALADALSAAGLDERWIEPLRLAVKMRGENQIDQATLSNLNQRFRAAKEKAAQREEEIRRQIAELQAQLPGFGKKMSPELEDVDRIWKELQPAGFKANLQAALNAMFRPLFDPTATIADFGLPRSADQLPPALRATFDAAGLIVDGRPSALTEPDPAAAVAEHRRRDAEERRQADIRAANSEERQRQENAGMKLAPRAAGGIQTVEETVTASRRRRDE